MSHFINNGFVGANGPPASDTQKGIVQFAKHNENLPLLAVQADDPRLIESKVVVFVLSGALKQGIQNAQIRLPFAGEIKQIYATCAVAGTSDTIIDIEKSGQAYIDNTDPSKSWKSIFVNKLVLDSGKNSNHLSSVPYLLDNTTVELNDHFRINVINAGTGISDLTVEIKIELTV